MKSTVPLEILSFPSISDQFDLNSRLMSIDFGFLHQNFSNVIDVGKVVNLKLSFVDSFLANFLVILVSFQQEYEEALANFFREIKMPARKKPLTLQSLSLRCIGSLFKHTCHSVTQEILDHLAIHESHLSFSHLKALKTKDSC